MQDRGDGRLGTVGDESGRPGTIEDGRGRVKTAGDCGGRPGMGEDGGGRWGTVGDGRGPHERCLMVSAWLVPKVQALRL